VDALAGCQLVGDHGAVAADGAALGGASSSSSKLRDALLILVAQQNLSQRKALKCF